VWQSKRGGRRARIDKLAACRIERHPEVTNPEVAAAHDVDPTAAVASLFVRHLNSLPRAV